jgi:phosphoribosylformimino-5-aminoimidazole carboxamide ribotide isomerase
MLIIPAIDIRGGKCVRLFQGDYGKETVYGDDPVEMAQRWIKQGAKFLHLVDLDGAREGIPHNKATIRAIVENSPVPVEVGGGIRGLDTLDEYLSLGIARVILGTAAIAHPDFMEQACAKWPGRVAADIAAKRGNAAISGWVRETEVRAVDLARRCEDLGAAVIIFTDVLRDGTRKGLNLEATREVARAIRIPLIASGGVSTIEDVKALLPFEKDGISGVIVGRALYAGTVKLPEAIVLAEGKGNSGAG